jgi:hypothetical membrane protein
MKKIVIKFKFTRIAGICGILFPIIIFPSILFAITNAPWFRWTKNALSDLGVEGLSAFIFNNGFILGGIVSLIFSLGLTKTLSNKKGAYLLIISSIALIGVGLFPKTLYILHYVSSAAFFIFLTISLFIIGITIKRNQIKHIMGDIAIIFAIIACSSIIFLNVFTGIAIPEAIVFFPALFWCMTYGIKMTIKS